MKIAAYITRPAQRDVIAERYVNDAITWFEGADDAAFPSRELVAAMQAVTRDDHERLVVVDAFHLGGGIAGAAWVEAYVGPGRFTTCTEHELWLGPFIRDPSERRAELRRLFQESRDWGVRRRQHARSLNSGKRTKGFPATGRNVRYGWRVIAGEVVVHPEERAAIREGLAMRAAGATLAEIGEYWLFIKFKPRPSSKHHMRPAFSWDRGTIRKILLGNADLEPLPLSAEARRFISQPVR